MTNDEIDAVLVDVDETMEMIEGPLGPVELMVTRNLYRTVELLLAAIRAGVVRATADQVAGLEMGQARLRVAQAPEG